MFISHVWREKDCNEQTSQSQTKEASVAFLQTDNDTVVSWPEIKMKGPFGGASLL